MSYVNGVSLVWIIIMGGYMENNKTKSILWEVYKIIRNLNNSDLNEVQILINRERTDRTRNNSGE